MHDWISFAGMPFLNSLSRPARRGPRCKGTAETQAPRREGRGWGEMERGGVGSAGVGESAGWGLAVERESSQDIRWGNGSCVRAHGRERARTPHCFKSKSM